MVRNIHLIIYRSNSLSCGSLIQVKRNTGSRTFPKYEHTFPFCTATKPFTPQSSGGDCVFPLSYRRQRRWQFMGQRGRAASKKYTVDRRRGRDPGRDPKTGDFISVVIASELSPANHPATVALQTATHRRQAESNTRASSDGGEREGYSRSPQSDPPRRQRALGEEGWR